MKEIITEVNGSSDPHINSMDSLSRAVDKLVDWDSGRDRYITALCPDYKRGNTDW